MKYSIHAKESSIIIIDPHWSLRSDRSVFCIVPKRLFFSLKSILIKISFIFSDIFLARPSFSVDKHLSLNFIVVRTYPVISNTCIYDIIYINIIFVVHV